jgi:hypothetical protein
MLIGTLASESDNKGKDKGVVESSNSNPQLSPQKKERRTKKRADKESQKIEKSKSKLTSDEGG